jgi:hypothetical protein
MPEISQQKEGVITAPKNGQKHQVIRSGYKIPSGMIQNAGSIAEADLPAIAQLLRQ